MRYAPLAHLAIPLALLLLAGCTGVGEMITDPALGVCGLLHLALAVWALVNIAHSRTTTDKKVLWALLVWLLPVVGLLIWLFAGPRRSRR